MVGMRRLPIGAQDTILPHARLERPTFQALWVELGGIGDCHYGHHAGLDAIADDEVGRIGDAAGHVQADDEQSFF